MCDDVPVDLVVNATTASGSDEEPGLATLVEEMRVVGCDLVVDINYGREQNMWQEFAVSRGARFMDGLPMLANQACLSFALWTGLEVPADEFLQALTENP
jgi:shikimate dehydrogenase